MPARPKLAAASAAATPVEGEVWKSWDQYQDDVHIEPFQMPISPGETLLIKCPTGGALRRLARAQATGDLEGIIDNAFGDQAEKVWELAENAPYPAILKLSNDVLSHYGKRAQELGE